LRFLKDDTSASAAAQGLNTLISLNRPGFTRPFFDREFKLFAGFLQSKDHSVRDNAAKVIATLTYRAENLKEMQRAGFTHTLSAVNLTQFGDDGVHAIEYALNKLKELPPLPQQTPLPSPEQTLVKDVLMDPKRLAEKRELFRREREAHIRKEVESGYRTEVEASVKIELEALEMDYKASLLRAKSEYERAKQKINMKFQKDVLLVENSEAEELEAKHSEMESLISKQLLKEMQHFDKSCATSTRRLS
jgi:hypothetical protein